MNDGSGDTLKQRHSSNVLDNSNVIDLECLYQMVTTGAAEKQTNHLATYQVSCFNIIYTV